MLKPNTLFLHTEHMARLTALAKKRGLATAVLVRIAISEFLRRELAKEKV